MTRLIKLSLASLVLTFGFYACGGASGSSKLPDADLDGVPDISDCAPADATLGGSDIANDGIDQDCTGVDKKVLKTTSQSDSNNDGVIDSEIITEYSLTGKTTKIDYGFGIYYYTYDANDNLLVEQIDDAVDGILLAAQNYDSSDPVNIGSSFEITIKDLIDIIVKETGFTGKITWDSTKPDGQPRRKLDVSRAKERFGFESQTTFEDGLRKTIAWYRENRSHL